MRNPPTTRVEVWAPGGEPTTDPQTGDVTYPPDVKVETVRAHFGTLSAEERYDRSRGAATENVEAYALVPLGSKVTPSHYVRLPGTHARVAGAWGIAGIEWRRTHLRLLLKRGAQ